MGYYYMTQAYQPGQVLNWLPAGDYTKILGLDMGSGTTRAYLYQYDKEDQGWQKRTLVLNRSQDGNSQVTIPTCISYREDRVCIGYDVDLGRATQNFKYPPTQWEMIKPDGVHTSREMQHDFTAQLLRQIKDNNGDILLGGKLLVAVGCPTSPDWMEADAYEELIREAIGHVHVTVVPEGWAAIWSVIGNLEATKGIAVYDLGASSVKFSYVLPGKCFRSRSRELGGNQIDEEIFDQVFADDDLSIENEKYIMPQIREIKEAYYPHKRPAGGELKDREGQVIRSLRLNDAVMHQVLGIREDGSLVRGAWYDRLRQFLEETKGWIGDLPCGYVVLIGGTSWIPEILELAEKAFFDWDVVVKRARNPEAAMVYGLCEAKRREIRSDWEQLIKMEEKMESEERKDYTSRGYRDQFFESLAYRVGESFGVWVQQIAESYWRNAQSVGIEAFLQEVRAKIDQHFTPTGLIDIHKKVLSKLERIEEKDDYWFEIYEIDRREPLHSPEIITHSYYEEVGSKLRTVRPDYCSWIDFSREDVGVIMDRYLDALDMRQVLTELKTIFLEKTERAVERNYLFSGPKLRVAGLWLRSFAERSNTKQDYTLTPEVLKKIGKMKLPTDQCVTEIKSRETMKMHFTELHQSLFEIALGQTLLLVFEEKADVQ